MNEQEKIRDKVATARSALRYYGGKWNLAPWIISHFPEHKNYVEPCGGAASVLLRKPPSLLETYNDLDGMMVNFFQVLRDRPSELIEKIELTPWARSEYELSLHPCDENDLVEKARRFFVSANMSFNGGTGSNPRLHGWRCSLDVRSRTSPSNDIIKNDLRNIARRLMSVQIENRDYKNIIERFDNNEAIIYMDPPYVASERTNSKGWYAFEWSNDDHIDASNWLKDCTGYVVISGYACQLYLEIYENCGWVRFDTEATVNRGNKRIESIWLSPKTIKALVKEKSTAKQISLFEQVSSE